MDGNATHPLIGQLRPIFAELHTCTPETLPSVMLKLDYVIEEERDALFNRNAMKSSNTASAKVFPNWLNQQLQELFKKPETYLAGVRVLRALLTVEYVDLNEMTKNFSGLLVACVLNTDDYDVGMEAGEVWGLLLNNGSSVVESIIMNCLEFSVELLMRGGHDPGFLEGGQGNGGSGSNSNGQIDPVNIVSPSYPGATKLSGCVFIRQLVRRVPSAIVPHISSILEGLRRAAIDYNRLVRISAADALYHTLRISYRSVDASFCRTWQDVLLSDVVRGLTYGEEVVLHGSLLFFNAILSSVTAGDGDVHVVDFSPHSAKDVRLVWSFVNDNLAQRGSTHEIKQEILNSLPLLAMYDHNYFAETSVARVKEVAARAFTATEGPDERQLLFTTVARLTRVLPEMVPRFLDRMMAHIERSLVKRPHRDRCLEAVTCFATLSEVAPNAVRPFLRHILKPLFAGSITEGFARDIAKICTAFPELRSTCLSRTLNSTAAQVQAARQRPVTTAAAAEDTRRFILANLNALSGLDFTGYSTLQFLCDVVVRHVSDPSEEVRRSAIDLCFKLALSGCSQSPCETTDTGVVIHHGREHMQLVTTVMKKLVSAAVADAESDIRLHTLERFTREFDYTLALQDIASSLFPALHDKHQNRIAAVRLLGRISGRNPACIYPMLRRVMVQCVADIQLFNNSKKLEQSTLVLSTIVESTPDMVKPYVSALLRDCVSRLHDSNQPVPVLTALLSCVGKLARYAEGSDVAVVAAIRPVVIGHILDSSSIIKKQEAIRTLGDIIRTTKEVNVYETHPELLRVLLSALHGGFKETWPVRLDVLKLMGIIGAVDPVRVKEISRDLRDGSVSAGNADTVLSTGSLRSEESIAHNVVANVLAVLRLPSLTDDQCLCAVQVIANVLTLKEASKGCLTSYADIISTVLHHATLQGKIREKLLNSLTRIVYLFGPHIRQHLDELLSTVVTFLPSAERGVLVEVLCLLGELRRSLREEFRPSLSSLLPPIINTVQNDPARASEPVFAFLVEMGGLLDAYLHNVLPCVCDVAGNASCPIGCRIAAVTALANFAKRLPRLVFHASRCIHCLCQVLKELEPSAPAYTAGSNGGNGGGTNSTLSPEVVALINVTLDATRDVARNLGRDFEKFTPMVFPVLDSYGKEGAELKTLISATVRNIGRVLAPDTTRIQREEAAAAARYRNPPQQRWKGSHEDKFASLRNVLVARDRETEEDWNMWLRQLAVELLRSSPSLSHGFAYYLAQIHEPFARHMLHSAFAVCYAEMDQEMKEVVTSLLGTVLRGERVPSEVLQELLNLSEFMERQGMHFNPSAGSQSTHTGLLFDLKTLMNSSERCNLYAKALHYVEIQFYDSTREFERGMMRGKAAPLPPDEWRNLVHLFEKSIYLCNLLGQRESAEGMLKYIQLNFSAMTGQPSSELPQMMEAQLFEKLQWWSQSLRAYEQGLQNEPNKFANMVGLMRSLDNLGDYGRLLELWKLFAPRVSKKEAAELAPYGAHAAWLLRAWDDMGRITDIMPDEGYVGTTAVFYRAVRAILKGQFHDAEPIIQLCRKRLDSTLSALVAESYDRAYGLFVGIQQLSELEEFAFVAKNPKGLRHWQSLWERRLGAMAYEGWPGTLANHALMIPLSKELDMWLRFVSLSRVNGRERTSSEILFELLGSQTISSALEQPVLPQPAIALAAFQHLYEVQERDRAIELLELYVSKVEKAGLSKLTQSEQETFAMCHSKLADWLFAQTKKRGLPLHAAQTQNARVMELLQQATSLDGSNGAIWHSWARFNHEIVTKAHSGDMTKEQWAEHVVCAMDGYIRSVRLSQELEDVLGFLSLWFTHASLPQVQGNSALQSAMLQVSPTVWLKVIPQIIARIHTKDPVISESVYQLLVLVARAHPQALLYNLSVTNASTQGVEGAAEQLERRKGAQRILSKIVEQHPNGRTLVSDAALVCTELVRCAVLWTELWFDELERAWYLWGRDKSAHNVLLTLQPLLQQMKAPETMAESQFVTEFGDLLYSACDSVEKAATLDNNVCMEEAWNRFKTAVKRMDEQINSMSSLALQLVSPKLMQNGKDLSLVVPGQYNETGQFPRIASFQSTLKVMNSKQHPRRLYINGSDGELYKFLLKGHEDLRLDERVMQLLAFVNTLLEKHSAVQRRDCMIQVFSVTPLSDNAGLVGWVDHCDTLHQLIKEYRVNPKYLSIEVNRMGEFGVALDRLTAIQHIEPFEYALEQTEGTDLSNSLWMRAPSAESWLDRRTTYVCSLATMSMVGHILGLGDRHPSNLMIHAYSGRVVHIDFGDCFEVAQNRSAFPERVPFRLTRMLVKAMEMGGIEGLFRYGCITVMGVLREEGSSILALLEAFVHDPLVSWWRDESEEGEGTVQSMTSGVSKGQAYSAMGESFQKSTGAYNVGSVHPARSVQLRAPPPPPTITTVPGQSVTFSGRASRASDVCSTGSQAHQMSKAHKVVNRIKEKLEGREFRRPSVTTPNVEEVAGVEEGMKVEAQVARLIEEATSNANLCVHYQGWCPFW